ncbi:fatty acyl-AMP ligase [Kitasatospora sp. NPDC097643]|uniref:fatty acyl-AMP ligase n=1 Tax=Kitasatospora sp. NPDC097643 TaxID=3157230 RepID=UPI003333D34F
MVAGVADFTDFTDLLVRRGAELPDREAFAFVDGGGLLARVSLGYGALDREAKRIASWLQQFRPAGKRVVLCHGDGADFVTAFLGCLYAGSVPVPAPAPRGRHAGERLVGILRDCAAAFVLTDSAHAPEVSQLLATGGQAQVLCAATDRAGLGDADAWRRPAVRPDTPALLQYTSGSVSEPRGVLVSHANLLANQRAIQRALGTDERSRIGGWLPFHHDMGLIGQFLHPLFLGAGAVVLRPRDFVERPVDWLRLVDRYGLTVTGGPDFAYDRCTRLATDEQVAALDLSRLEAAVTGAEPIQAATLERFVERFAPAGLRPEALRTGYGLAEATLLVSVGRWGAGAGRAVDAAELERKRVVAAEPGRPARTVVSVGAAADGLDLLIVDPEDFRVLPDGRVGEIWVRGGGVAGAYWDRPRESTRIFDARPASAGGRAGWEEREGGFLRTGDLGFLADGELFVTGRLKEVLVVAGRTLYPQDIEQRVQKASALFGSAVAFTVEADRDHVVVVQEIRPFGDVEFPALVSAVQRTVAEDFEIAAETVLLVRPGTVRRTSSGKLRRSAMRELFLTGRIRPLHAVVSGEVGQLVGELVGQARGNADEPFKSRHNRLN